MASNINPYTIDGTFPIANQDNSSQGFRDNFTNTKNNFIVAEQEISDLQAKAILTSALNNGQKLTNDMAGAQIKRPQFTAWTESALDLGTVSGTVILDFGSTVANTGANFQKMVPVENITLNFVNWPALSGSGLVGYGVMRVWINIPDLPSLPTVTLPSSVSIGSADLAWSTVNNDNTVTLTFDAPGDYIFDFSSADGGSNYQIFDLSRNRATFRDPMLYFNDNINPTLLVGYGEGFLTANLLETGQDRVSSFGSYNSVAVGNLTLANVANPQIDTGGLGGYSVSSSRGDITTGNFQPVQANDLVGYVNSIVYTGNGSGNTFQQTAAIDFFVHGGDAVNGRGGNIAFFTSNHASQLVQALSVHHDQTVITFANLVTANTYVPSSKTAGGTTGQISYDSNYIYICLGPNNWKRANVAAW